jgi:hypothetical protein
MAFHLTLSSTAKQRCKLGSWQNTELWRESQIEQTSRARGDPQNIPSQALAILWSFGTAHEHDIITASIKSLSNDGDLFTKMKTRFRVAGAISGKQQGEVVYILIISMKGGVCLFLPLQTINFLPLRILLHLSHQLSSAISYLIVRHRISTKTKNTPLHQHGLRTTRCQPSHIHYPPHQGGVWLALLCNGNVRGGCHRKSVAGCAEIPN